jgi:hypothetical protein
MSEYDFEDQELDNTPENDGNETDRNSRQFVRDLEKQAKAGKQAAREAEEAKREADAAKRELAFLKAGIDMDSPSGKLFAKAYDGDASLDSVKAAAAEYGLLPTSQTDEVKSDLEALSRVSQAATSSTGSVAPSAVDAIRNAGSPEEIMKILAENNIAISHEQPGEWISLVGR